MGLASRRRYRWTRGRVTRLLGRGVHPGRARGARRASTTSRRSSPAWAAAGRRGCATCSAPSRPTRTPSSAPGRAARSSSTAGPGTGKTVVALHRTAYLLYSDPRLGDRRGGVLFVGPHQPYLAYVADVLPSLGEEGVQTCTLRDLRARGCRGGGRGRPGGGAAEGVGRDGARRSSRPCGCTRSRPTEGMEVETPWADVWLSAERLGRGVRRRPTPARRTTRRATRSGRSCSTILVDKHEADEDVSPDLRPPVAGAERRAGRRLRPGLAAASRRPTSSATCGRCRPTCGMCAPWLEPDEVRALQRADPQAWTVSDLPLLDAARQRLGDPEASRRTASARGGRRRRARARWPRSSTTWSRPTTRRCR